MPTAMMPSTPQTIAQGPLAVVHEVDDNLAEDTMTEFQGRSLIAMFIQYSAYCQNDLMMEKHSQLPSPPRGDHTQSVFTIFTRKDQTRLN